MQIFTNPNYDFVKWRLRLLIPSLIIILAGLGVMFTKGINVGIDFAGGANILLRFQEQMPISQIRGLVPQATIQQYGPAEDNSLLIRLPKARVEGDYAGQTVAALHRSLNPDAQGRLDLNFSGRDALGDLLKSADPAARGTGAEADAFYGQLAQNVIDRRSEIGIFHNFQELTTTPGMTPQIANFLQERVTLGKFNVLNQETVGPQVGRELQRKALLAVILSSLAMGVYITLRFDLKFGIAAVVAIVHDVLVALAVLALINGEFSLNIVAALLLIVGYSINDSVVTYDRVRENQRKTRVKIDFPTQLNNGINQTLSRTVLTSGTTMLVLIALIAFGGAVINEFAWILFAGVVAGTYSTVTVVPAVAIAWNRYISKGSSSKTPARVERSAPQAAGKRANG